MNHAEHIKKDMEKFYNIAVDEGSLGKLDQDILLMFKNILQILSEHPELKEEKTIKELDALTKDLSKSETEVHTRTMNLANKLIAARKRILNRLH